MHVRIIKGERGDNSRLREFRGIDGEGGDHGMVLGGLQPIGATANGGLTNQ